MNFISTMWHNLLSCCRSLHVSRFLLFTKLQMTNMLPRYNYWANVLHVSNVTNLFVPYLGILHTWMYRKWFLEKIGHEGMATNSYLFLPASCSIIFLVCEFMHTIFAIIGLNNLLKAYEDKSAYAMCIFSLALGPEEEPITFVGKTPVRCCFELTSEL